MNCFYHPEFSAVGICKSCNRGICRDCAAEHVGGLACRDRCEEDVEQLSALLEHTMALQASARQRFTAQRVASAFSGAFIALFGVFFIWAGFADDRTLWVLVALGVLLAFFGGYVVLKAVLMKAPGSPPRDPGQPR